MQRLKAIGKCNSLLNNGGGVAPPEVEALIIFIMAAILYDLLNESPNIKIEISLANLIEAVDYAAKLSIAEVDRQRQAQPEQYLTRKQAAGMLDVDLSTLWRWNNENYLCAVEIGGKRKYKLSEVNKILGRTAV